MTPIDCESRIARVVVYARGAVITRTVAIPAELPAEPLELRILGLTALAEVGSLRANVEGDREVLALRPRLSIPGAPTRPGRLREEVRALVQERQRLEAERAHLNFRRAEIGGRTLDLQFPRWSSKTQPAARFGDALAFSGLLGAELARVDQKIRALDEALADNQRRVQAAELALSQGTPTDWFGEEQTQLEVLVRLSAPLAAPARARVDPGAPRGLEIEYVVAAARWWPAYTARFSAQATQVSFTLDAFVAQASGEDWTRAKLAVCTADLAHDARLPELRSLRLGRAQPAPRKGYRPPPIGLEAMFEGHDRALERLAPPRPAPKAAASPLRRSPPPPAASPSMAALSAPPPPGYGPPPQGFGPPAAGGPPQVQAMRPMMMPGAAIAPPMRTRGAAAAEPPPPMAEGFGSAPAPQAARAASRSAPPEMARMRRLAASPQEPEEDTVDSVIGAAVAAEALGILSEPLEPDDAWLDFDALVLAEPGDRGRRGRLVKPDGSAAGARAEAARGQIERLDPPPEARDPLETRGRFDHRHDTEGVADVPSSGRPHRIVIATAQAPSRPRFLAVPREAAEVYREAEIQNPFAAPLLSGPVEVFIDGALLTTASLGVVDQGGVMHLGLGVEDRLRVARNARVQEGTAGLLGGSTTIEHTVTIDVTSSLGQKVAVEVLDRIPVTDDKDIDIKVLYARPESEKYTQAERGAPMRRGLRFRIEVPPGDKQRIEFAYRVSLSAKSELVGGNRRE